MLQRTTKKGVSIMVGYVLLVTLAIVMGGVMYAWMKSYVPQEELACPDGVSVIITGTSYNCTTNMLNLSVVNNGRFAVAGFYLKVRDDPDQSLATVDITRKLSADQGNFLTYSGALLLGAANDNAFFPGNTSFEQYSLGAIGRAYAVELIPVRWQTHNNKLRFIGCGEATKFTQTLSCNA